MSGHTGLRPTYAQQVAAGKADQRALVTATASGDTTIVAAQGAGKKILPLMVVVSTDTAVTIKFRSNSTDITAPIYMAANSTGVLDPRLVEILLTAANEALKINLSATANVGITCVWREAA